MGLLVLEKKISLFHFYMAVATIPHCIGINNAQGDHLQIDGIIHHGSSCPAESSESQPMYE